MKYVIKYFSEIALKSSPVRRRFVSYLGDNLRAVLRDVDSQVKVRARWDRIVVTLSESGELEEDKALAVRAVAAMRDVSGIEYILRVEEHPLPAIEDIAPLILPVYAPLLAGKTFVVRCKRSGHHAFRSVDVERRVGSDLMRLTEAAGVSLKQPELKVELEVSHASLFVVTERYRGIAGYPVASLDGAISLISGGFDSTVATYLTMKRGMRTHFLFFNLGGRDHELGVKETALYLWQKFGCKQLVLFITVPFEAVVAELLSKVDPRYMGVVLKRMMLRAADQIAEELDLDALVTGECVAQVSSQTLHNLAVIDAASQKLVLRPLIASNKGDIVTIARDIGTEAFAANMPEYCGVISVNPKTRAKLPKVVFEESKFDMAVLEGAMAAREMVRIDKLADEDRSTSEVEVLSAPIAESTIIDIRHPDEAELSPLRLHSTVLHIPFYSLHKEAVKLATDKVYMLYCGKGVMSRIQAAYIREEHGLDAKVYAP